MFIYAFARALAVKWSSELVLITSTGFVGDSYQRQYQLNNFNISGRLASKMEAFDYLGSGRIRNLSFFVHRHIPLLSVQMVKEGGFHFNKRLVEGLKGNIFLEGYWQSEKYFSNVKDQIREDFSFKNDISKDVKDELALIKSYGQRAVALGIRRYQEVKTFELVKVIGMEYYQKAMFLMAQKVENPVFFCFTQDRKWAEENLDTHYKIIFIDEKTGDNGAIEDHFLFRNFSNYIISNSTFSLIGAWLHSDNNLVIEPKNWFKKKESGNKILNQWIKLEN